MEWGETTWIDSTTVVAGLLTALWLVQKVRAWRRRRARGEPATDVANKPPGQTATAGPAQSNTTERSDIW